MNEPFAADLEAFRQKCDHLLATLSSISDAVVATDIASRITLLNSSAESLTGCSQDAVGKPLADVVRIVDERSHQPVELPTVQALRDGRSFESALHLLLVSMDGTERSISHRVSALRDDDGEVAGMVLVIRDITQHRLSEREMEKSIGYANDIVATLREPFLVLDQDLRVRTANGSFYREFRVSEEATENRLVFDLGNGQWDIPALHTLLGEVLSLNQPIDDYEVEHTFPDLGRRTMLLNARPFPPDSTHPELILLAIEDVSALRERADELAEIDRRKNEFLAMLAHELRNPLAPIRSALQVIRLSGMEREEGRTASEMMERQIGQMARLVDDLLDISRINRGTIGLRTERVELTSLLRHAVEAARPSCTMGQELTVTLPSQPIHVNADPVRLEQVVGNLLSNACKFTEEGGRIALTAETDGDFAVIRVKDSGIGIAPDQLPRIFDMFMQVESSEERLKRGLGIGLTLVKNLVERHEGTIEVHSDGVGQGTEFVVRLPVFDPHSQPLREPTYHEPARAASCCILVVDDNRDAATSIAMLLRIVGNETHTAFDGPEAIEAVGRIQPNVVLLDLGLPTMNGFEVCRRIRQQPQGEEIFIIAVTGWGDEEYREKAREAGFDGHLGKPVELSTLMRMLTTFMLDET